MAAEEAVIPSTTPKKNRPESSVGKLRACLQCNLVMSEDQFLQNGCVNCPDLHMEGNKEAVWSHTSTNFKGLAAILRPDISWVARYNDIQGVPGTYAVNH